MSQQSLLGIEQSEATTDDYYTPEWIFDGMGLEFDLDPAAPPGGVEYIPAKRYLTKQDDGLNAEWVGKVWLNPPFSEMSPWARKWIAHGNGVLLAPVSKAAWPSEVMNAANAIWVPRSGIPFRYADGTEKFVSYATFLAAVGEECTMGLHSLAAEYPGALLRTYA